MKKIDATEARPLIWEELRKVARPDSRFSWEFGEFITDYEGNGEGARRFCETELYQNAEVIFVTPDNNLERLREQVIRDRKTLVMTNYGITRGFFLVTPDAVPEGKEELASLLDGVGRYWKHQTLKQLKASVGRIDVLVSGASAITPGGVRFGKGHGYFDLEWAMLYTMGIVDTETPVVAAGHDCQIMDADVAVREFDTAIDYIVTPTKVIKTRNEYPKPTKGIIWSLLEPEMRAQIPPLYELWCKIHCK